MSEICKTSSIERTSPHGAEPDASAMAVDATLTETDHGLASFCGKLGKHRKGGVTSPIFHLKEEGECRKRFAPLSDLPSCTPLH